MVNSSQKTICLISALGVAKAAVPPTPLVHTSAGALAAHWLRPQLQLQRCLSCGCGQPQHQPLWKLCLQKRLAALWKQSAFVGLMGFSQLLRQPQTALRRASAPRSGPGALRKRWTLLGTRQAATLPVAVVVSAWPTPLLTVAGATAAHPSVAVGIRRRLKRR